MMIFVQVILGGGSFVLGWDVRYHLVWGTLTFIVLIVSTVLARRDFGVNATLFQVALAVIVDFVVQGILGLFAFVSGVSVVLHVTHAFLLAVTSDQLMWSGARDDKASTTILSQTQTAPTGN